MPTALCRPARRWSEWCSTPRAASAKPMVAALCASSSLLCAVTMQSTVRRTSVLSRSAWTSSTSFASSSCSIGFNRPSWWGEEWPPCKGEPCRYRPHRPQLRPALLLPIPSPTLPRRPSSRSPTSHRHPTQRASCRHLFPAHLAMASLKHQCLRASLGPSSSLLSLSHPSNLSRYSSNLHLLRSRWHGTLKWWRRPSRITGWTWTDYPWTRSSHSSAWLDRCSHQCRWCQGLGGHRSCNPAWPQDSGPELQGPCRQLRLNNQALSQARPHNRPWPCSEPWCPQGNNLSRVRGCWYHSNLVLGHRHPRDLVLLPPMPCRTFSAPSSLPARPSSSSKSSTSSNQTLS